MSTAGDENPYQASHWILVHRNKSPAMKAGIATKLFKIHPGLHILDENLRLKPSESLLLKLLSSSAQSFFEETPTMSSTTTYDAILVSFTVCAVPHKKKREINHSPWQCNHHKKKKRFGITTVSQFCMKRTVFNHSVTTFILRSSKS